MKIKSTWAPYCQKLYCKWRDSISLHTPVDATPWYVAMDGLPDIKMRPMLQAGVITLSPSEVKASGVNDVLHLVELSKELLGLFRYWLMFERCRERAVNRSPLEELTYEFSHWLKVQDLVAFEGDAEELLYEPFITPYQRDYLTSFVLRWDRAKEFERTRP